MVGKAGELVAAGGKERRYRCPSVAPKDDPAMKYPEAQEFNRIYAFAKRAEVTYLPFKRMYEARIAGKRRAKGAIYQFTIDDSRLIKVEEFLGGRREEPIPLDRPLNVKSELDFAWKLFCILIKRGTT